MKKPQILLDSLRTNCAMVRAMCKIGQKTLAIKYLKMARADKAKLEIWRLNNQLDATKTWV